METCVYLISQFYFISTTSLTSLCVCTKYRKQIITVFVYLSGCRFRWVKQKQRKVNELFTLWLCFGHIRFWFWLGNRDHVCVDPISTTKTVIFFCQLLTIVPSLCRNHPCSIPILSIRSTIIKLSHRTSKIISYWMKFPLCLWILYLVILIKVKFKYFAFI